MPIRALHFICWGFMFKLTKLMYLIVKHHIYGETRCWMYAIEWQKRGLPHAHILIRLKTKIQMHKKVSQRLSSWNTHWWWWISTIQTPKTRRWMTYKNNQNEKCHVLLCYRKHSKLISTLNIVIPSNLSSTYANTSKGSDMAVVSIDRTDARNDEVSQFQTGRYISSNRLFGVFWVSQFTVAIPILLISVIILKMDWVYFTADTARNVVAELAHTTLTAFFVMCEEDVFAKTLLYAEVPKYYTWNATSKKFQRRKQGMCVEGYRNLYSSDALSVFTQYI